MGTSSVETKLVLASASPRRQALLRQLGLTFSVDPAELDERPLQGETARDYVVRIARAKAALVAARHPGALVLAADTTVVVDETVLGKPKDADEARAMLTRLSGREHQVMSAVALDGAERSALRVETTVRFRPLTAEEIEWYVGTGEPLDKAGAYGIQGMGGSLVLSIDGSYSNVVGLPLAETIGMLKLARFPLPWDVRP
ncbi:MAG: septum formation inhibitor Maf [Myxococcaceae bacterium]|nr:septum formation inhibitor Maf [Myxococcaceae bacterium]